MSDLRKGSQRPTLLFEPEGDIDWTLSDIAVEWAEKVAGYVLDPWQSWLVRWTFARGNDRLWMARDVGAEVTRQSGKNIWLEVVELVGALEFGDTLQIHSAHRADTSHEHFVSLRSRIESSDELMSLMPSRQNHGFITTNGNESIEFGNGHRVLFKSRNRGSGRGPRPRRLVFDEALVLTHEQIGSMAPGISAQRNPQIIFASSAPKTDSEVLHDLRTRAKAADPADRFFYAAWNNTPDVNPDDPECWYHVNPSLGYGRMTEQSLNANRKLMSAEEFAREHLGIPEEPEGVNDGPISLERWDQLADGDSMATDHSVRLALDVSADRRFSTFAVAGFRIDRLGHVAVRDRRPGTDWVLERARELTDGHGVPVVIVTNSPASSFIDSFVSAGIPVDQMTPSEYAQACGRFIDATRGEHARLRHRGDHLRSAVASVRVKESGDGGMVWSRRSSKATDITPLTAATAAWGRVDRPAADEAEYTGSFLSLSDF